MIALTSPGDVPRGIAPSAVAIGKFDGVHTGHRAVLDALTGVARERGLTSVVVTFDRHPLALLAPEACPPPLATLEQKLELLAAAGVDATLALTFDRSLADTEPDDFVADVLVAALGAEVVLVGRDFRFGRRNSGDVDTLVRLGREHGFAVTVVDDVAPVGHRAVSSTWIRELVAAGDVAHAARLLGRDPAVRGVVVPGARRGRELGFPTANLSPESVGLIPADGVYAGWLTDDGVRRPAAVSVGDNPTFEGVPARQVEAYVLDADLDLYGHEVDVAFTERIRGQVAYRGVGPLVEQMHDDVTRVRELLAGRVGPASPSRPPGTAQPSEPASSSAPADGSAVRP